MKKQWWHYKVAYQIYPKSFCDSDGDGIGDIRGIISKLDYLRELGVDIIWISPCYKSPWADQGYDISDYYSVDPRFGTMADMDELIAEARRRDMYILMDLVVNHCSDEHEWFRAACADPEGKYGKYFYIEDRPADGGLPCNLRSCFGGPVWSPLPGHPDKLYLHMFHQKQPDLNWENPEVREEIYRNIDWWMDRGIAGFRIDAIINIKKLIPFRSYPADRDDGLCDVKRMLEDVEGIGDFLGEMRDREFIPRKALTIGEVFNERYDEIAEFIGEGGYFSSMFDFSHVICGKSALGWYDHMPITTEDFKRSVISAQERIGDAGYFSTVIENHDRPRAPSYYLPEEGRTGTGKKCLALAYFMLRGLPFIYQGQEIGMENWLFDSIGEVDDCSTHDEYKVSLDAGLDEAEALEVARRFSRDNARTPVQWDDSAGAGFTTGMPWLTINPDYKRINVRREREDPDSLYHFYRKMIALRKDPEYAETIVHGEFVPVLEEYEGLLAYIREGARKLLVLANLSSEEREVVLPGRAVRVLIDNMQETCAGGGETLRLKGWQGIMLELE